MNFSVNNLASEALESKVIPNASRYNIDVHHLDNGGTLLDMGVHAKGGWMAGKAFTETCLGGMGRLAFGSMQIGAYAVPSAMMYVDCPAVAELASHCASFYVNYRGMRVSISGPFRAIPATDVFSRAVEYKDVHAKKAVCHFQTTDLPTEELFTIIGNAIGFDPCDIYILAARTGTLTGCIQVCARNVEQTLPSLYDQGFDVSCILQASGSAPVISIVDDEQLAYGRVNDGLIYGQETNLYVDCDDAAIERVLPILPFCKNEEFGTPFYDLFASCDNDWAKVPRRWDAPSKVNFYNIRTNHAFVAGQLHYGVLEKAFLG